MTTSMLTFGTYRLNGALLEQAIRQSQAIANVSVFDTAKMYQNEAVVGSTLASIRNLISGPLHLSTKISRRSRPVESIASSLLNVDPFIKVKQTGDTISVLLHWPMPKEVWFALENATAARQIDSCGVCNHTAKDLQRLLQCATLAPSVNQIEIHPFVPRAQLLETIRFCRENGIGVQAHTVFARGMFFDDHVLVSVAKKHQRTVAQVMMRWAKQIGAHSLCLSSKNAIHMREWCCVDESSPWYFCLDDDDMHAIAKLSESNPVQFYANNSAAKSKSNFHQEKPTDVFEKVEFSALEALVREPTYSWRDVLGKKIAYASSGVSFASTRVQKSIELIVATLEKDIALQNDQISNCASLFPSTDASPNLTLAVGQQLFSAKFTSDLLAKKYRNDVAKMDRAIVAKMREVLRQLRHLLLQRDLHRRDEERASKKKTYCTMKVSPSGKKSYDMGFDRPFSDAVLHPEPMPVTVPDAKEFEPFFKHISSGGKAAGPTCSMKNTSFAKGSAFSDGRIDVCKQVVGSQTIGDLCAAVRDNSASSSASSNDSETFGKGTMFSDGRVDVCKQVVGAEHVAALCSAVKENASMKTKICFGEHDSMEKKTEIQRLLAHLPNIEFFDEKQEQKTLKAKHFLLGNNVACRSSDGKDDDVNAGKHIADLMSDDSVPIETWYLAGNGIGPQCTEMFAKALENNKCASALWLKRNPIGRALGPRSLGRLLSMNQHLRVLDLHNVGLSDQGVKEFVDAATSLGVPNRLEFLYLDANGITGRGADYLVPYLTLNRDVLQGFYISLNRLGSNGAMTICDALASSKSLKSLCLDANAIDNVGAAHIFKHCCPTWPKINAFSIGIYKSVFDMGEMPNFIGADLPPGGDGGIITTNQPQLIPESDVVVSLIDFIENAPELQFCSIRGNRFSVGAQKVLAASAWKRAPNFHFNNIQLYATVEETPIAPNLEKSRLQLIKHGPLIVNIESIYRNAM